MEPIKAKFERSDSLNIQDLGTNNKNNIQLERKYSLENDAKAFEDDDLTQPTDTDEKIPEIKDIYDYIYGNVQSKLQFYEGKRSGLGQPRPRSSRPSISENCSDGVANSETSSEISVSPRDFSYTNENSFVLNTDLTPEANSTAEKLVDQQIVENKASKRNSLASLTSTDSNQTIDKITQELHSNPDLLKECESSCPKCRKADYINDRTDVLTEINTNIKLELDSVKNELKKEIAKNNELNFEIANIESALETYYKDAKNQKSAFSSLYATMKSYTSGQKGDFRESYTYKRVKVIADYIESLKNKLEHQDRIIKSNFIENPYYTDVIIKHEIARKQLDEISQENQELKEEIKKKTAEEVDIIKELNRQKFQIENKCKEIENYYKNELENKEDLIKATEEEHLKQLSDFQLLLDQKDQEMAKMQKAFETRISNYKQELLIVYRKWKEQKKYNLNT